MATTWDNGATPYQEIFVSEMRIRREAGGLSRNKLAQLLGCTPQWLAKVEAYDRPPSEGLADDLDTYFKSDGLFRRLWEKHAEARKRGLIPKGIRPLTIAEQKATQLFIFAPLTIPGLLQAEEYARIVLSAEQRASKLEEFLAVRMERQRIFERSDPPLMFVMIREAVIRDLPSEAVTAQCKHLLGMMESPNISIQVIPSQAPVFQGGGFQLLSFNAGPDAAYVDGASGYGQTFTDPQDVRRLTVLFNLIRSTASSTAETANLIRTIMEGT
ncbi:transcriptional regulator [Actinomadura cremea]|nr:transcriptional regulator [Actinomadura cremea]